MMMYDRGDRDHRPMHEILKDNKIKATRKSVVYVASWTHLLSFLFEMVFLERPEVIWGNNCKLKNKTIRDATVRQLSQLFMNAGELTHQQMELVINFWFGK